jgi:AcrR family transcriptional regulator
VSPAIARTSHAAIVGAGRDLLEAGGPGTVTMQAVAERVGVRAPSLYKRFSSRDALIAAIASATLDDLGEALAPPSSDPDPAAGLRAVAVAYRAFAQANPQAFGLLSMNLPAAARPPVEHSAQAARPVLDLAARLVGSDRALEAARVVTAFATGFISMELAGAFRLGGDVDEAYRYGIAALVDALGHRRGTGRQSRSSPRP